MDLRTRRRTTSAEVDASEEHVEKQVLTRLELCHRLGKGAYGMVWKVVEKRTRRVVALKKCFDVFRRPIDAQCTYREIMYLEKFAGHDNIVGLQHVIKSDSNQDVYLTFEHMQTDLLAVIREQILQPIHIKYVVYQILKALKYVHSAGVVHRDVKPSNVLINEDCHVRLCDFGLARSCVFDTETHNPQHTDYASTRWYRAIEVLLGSTKYTQAVDVWGLGCVCGEMFLGRPVFPGVSTIDQIARIRDLLGAPDDDLEVLQISAYAPTLLEMLPPLRPVSFVQVFPDVSAEAINFLGMCLTFLPAMRFPVPDALKHPYMAEFHDPDDEPSFPTTIKLALDDYQVYTIDDYRNAIYDTIFKRKVAARKLELKCMTNPASVALMEHEETLPEPF
ncbi:hypothetical protein CTAYLR_004725 [Chrysophaeum taylorii]|uniref:Mitogen-activated protein kinase n=1 Tax=Chrysophaeum taylorii TaxID=2483200 RepID=A0AAD7U959_9STRA|nr:hypothetical protein CTAYLR_004725 [Chrysophaeum taylorii]